MTLIKRRIEVVAFERQRQISRPVPVPCPVCRRETVLLTVRQAGALAQVQPRSIYRWLAGGRAHGVRTPGGRHRVCRHSLFLTPPAPPRTATLETLAAPHEEGRPTWEALCSAREAT